MNFRWGKRFGLVRASLYGPSRTIIILLGFVLTWEAYWYMRDLFWTDWGKTFNYPSQSSQWTPVHIFKCKKVNSIQRRRGGGGGEQNIDGYYKWTRIKSNLIGPPAHSSVFPAAFYFSYICDNFCFLGAPAHPEPAAPVNHIGSQIGDKIYWVSSFRTKDVGIEKAKQSQKQRVVPLRAFSTLNSATFTAQDCGLLTLIQEMLTLKKGKKTEK